MVLMQDERATSTNRVTTIHPE